MPGKLTALCETYFQSVDVEPNMIDTVLRKNSTRNLVLASAYGCMRHACWFYSGLAGAKQNVMAVVGSKATRDIQVLL